MTKKSAAIVDVKTGKGGTLKILSEKENADGTWDLEVDIDDDLVDTLMDIGQEFLKDGDIVAQDLRHNALPGATLVQLIKLYVEQAKKQKEQDNDTI